MLLITLLACYDFEGDNGVLGFATDLNLSTTDKWTPEYLVAAGTDPSVGVMQRVGAEDDEPAPAVWGDADFEGVFARGTEVRFQGPDEGCGEVFFDGELQDHFTMCFGEPGRLELYDPYAPEDALETVALAAPATLHLRVLDLNGEPMGFRADDLQLDGSGWLRGDQVRVLRPGEVRVGVAGVSATLVVLDDAAVEFETVVVGEEDGYAVEHTFGRTRDGVSVLGL